MLFAIELLRIPEIHKYGSVEDVEAFHKLGLLELLRRQRKHDAMTKSVMKQINEHTELKINELKEFLAGSQSAFGDRKECRRDEEMILKASLLSPLLAWCWGVSSK